MKAAEKVMQMRRDFAMTTITTPQELEDLLKSYTEDDVELYTNVELGEMMGKKEFIEYMKRLTGMSRRINS